MAHRKSHKKACQKRAAELHDEELFKEPPVVEEECPICMLPLPLQGTKIMFTICCGKYICRGCMHAQIKQDVMSGKKCDEAGICAFCRSHYSVAETEEQTIARIRKFAHNGNPNAMKELGVYFLDQSIRLPNETANAKELLLRAGQLGNARAYHVLGNVHVEEGDHKRGQHFWELAAMMGNAEARYQLGLIENDHGNHQRCVKHILMAARSGHDEALDAVREGFLKGGIYSKDEYDSALKAYQKLHEERRSEMRTEADVYRAKRSLRNDIR